MPVEFDEGLSYFDEGVYFGFVVEGVFAIDFADGFELVVSDEIEDPAVEMFFDHGVGVDLLEV